MTDHELYQRILGLTGPWRVIDVFLDLNEGQVLIYVDHDSSLGQLTCPECNSACPGYDKSKERRWRHLDTCQLRTYLVCSVPRINCCEHGVNTASVPWSSPQSRFTLEFETLAISILRATGVQAKAAGILRLSSDQVHDIMHRAVDRGLARRSDTELIKQLSIDEKSFRRNHHYVTVLGDAARGRVLDIAEGRTKEATSSLLQDTLSTAQLEGISVVTMDMWRAFMEAAQEVLPHADIAHDRFHVVKYLAGAVDQTRNAEAKRLAKTHDRSLKQTKFLFLKNPEKLSDSQRQRLEHLVAGNFTTAHVWEYKESFRQFYGSSTAEQAAAFFESWYEAATKLRNTFLGKVARMLREHLSGLIASVVHRVSNAVAEGLNSQIQQIKANARGYRRFESFRVAILFHLGKLDLNPQLCR